jgi:hypothetical protein
VVKGRRRARNVRGSLQSDRSKRWGPSVTGVCRCALRACCMWCTVFAPARIEARPSTTGSNAPSRPGLEPGCVPATLTPRPTRHRAGNQA